MAFQLVTALAIASLGLPSDAAESRLQAPPFNLPFDPKKPGKTYTFNVKVTDPFVYEVSLRFFITRPSKYSHFFDRVSVEESKRLHAILGGAVLVAPGSWLEVGVPAKLFIQILTSPENKLLLSELVDHPKTAATYMGRYATLAQSKLSAGVYTVRVEYLEGSPDLEPLYAEISFAKAHRGK